MTSMIHPCAPGSPVTCIGLSVSCDSPRLATLPKQDLQDGDGACSASGHTCSYKFKVIQEGILVLISCAVYDL